MANLNIKEIVEWMIEKAKDKASDSIAVIDEGEIVKEFGGNIRRGGQDSFRCVKNLVARLSCIRAIMILTMMMEF